MHIFCIEVSPILKFFLKSTNLKYSTISLKSHSTETLTEFIALLNVQCSISSAQKRGTVIPDKLSLFPKEKSMEQHQELG